MRPRARGAVLVIRAYQRAVSPLLGSRCRFHPSCSEYTAASMERFGLLKGLWLGVRRLARCHPFDPGGVDEVPDRFSFRRIRRTEAVG